MCIQLIFILGEDISRQKVEAMLQKFIKTLFYRHHSLTHHVETVDNSPQQIHFSENVVFQGIEEKRNEKCIKAEFEKGI